jgi:hypothetical protein
VDEYGRFDVMLSPERPRGYEGSFWRLDPTSNMLLMRLVSSDWADEREPSVAIERLDVPARRPGPSAAALETKLSALPSAIDFIATLLIDHVELLRREGYVNSLKVFDLSTGGGLQGQFYYEGAYDLAEEEALILETKAPEHCLYRSLILTNELYETVDWYNNHASLNDAQALSIPTGCSAWSSPPAIRACPTGSTPVGHPRGVIQGRWTECNSTPVPTVHKVKVADLPSIYPSRPRTSRRSRDGSRSASAAPLCYKGACGSSASQMTDDLPPHART